MLSAVEALEKLREGNRRYAAGIRSMDSVMSELRRSALVRGQHPHAVVLGCSDSRVPVEMIFDQGLGHLFVIRVAGNIVAPSQVASVEFAATQFGTRLVVVLGHSYCGAVRATLDALQAPAGGDAHGLHSIVSRIRPAVEKCLETGLGSDPESVVRAAVRSNVSASAEQLRHGSEVIENLIDLGGLRVIGAEYSLETGVVDFFDGVPIAL